MPKAERILLQVRVSAADKQRIKSLATKQGLTLQKAVVEAFNAWAEKLRVVGHHQSRTKTGLPNSPALPDSRPSPPSASWAWLKQAIHLDWTKCPEVELLEDGVHQVWVLRETDAPLNQVLRAVADGDPVSEIAEIFDLQLAHLAKVLEFAGAAQLSNALN
jgi:hypothetical protein